MAPLSTPVRRIEIASLLALLGLAWVVLGRSGFLSPGPDARMTALARQDSLIVERQALRDGAQDDRQLRIERALESLVRLECVRAPTVYQRLARLECGAR